MIRSRGETGGGLAGRVVLEQWELRMKGVMDRWRMRGGGAEDCSGTVAEEPTREKLGLKLRLLGFHGRRLWC